MAVIDADTHVDECEDTWAHMTPDEDKFRPVTVSDATTERGGRPGYSRNWLIDGGLKVRRIRDDQRTGTTVDARELHDIQARLRHMDAMGVDVHVIYPTLFLTYLTGDPAIQAALCRSYNRWLAEKTAASGGRLRWVAVLPTLDIDAAVDELRWASDRGACGVYKLATEYDKKVTSPSFYSIYEEAQALDFAICIHTGSANPPRGGDSGSDLEGLGGTNVMEAMFSVVFSGLSAKFPRLRWGFIEAGSSWIPYVLDRLHARRERMAWAYNSFNYSDDVKDIFRQHRLYVTCQSHEDIPYLLQFGTEDHLLIGTDYSHADQSAEIEAIDLIRRMGDDGRITKTQVKKILEDNPAALYGL
jgi:predicted TIM-barrel fold metal-dependent hydrolase